MFSYHTYPPNPLPPYPPGISAKALFSYAIREHYTDSDITEYLIHCYNIDC